MFQSKNLVVVTAIAISLAACASGQDTAVNTPPAAVTPVQTAETSPSVAASPAEVNIASLGVSSASDIKFQPLANDATSENGFFDTVNDANQGEYQVSKSSSLKLAGWAISPSDRTPADQVLITQGENNEIVAIAPVSIERPDVAQNANNQAYLNSGWLVVLNPANLPADSAVLKAWAYNSDTKEAVQLNGVHTVTFTN